MKRLLFALLLVAGSTLAGAQGVVMPADTDFHSDVCLQCGMAVTSKSYAAQIVTEGQPLFFDDIGCLVQYERQRKIAPEAVLARFVRTVAGDAWIAAEQALWVTTKDIRTPMGYGLHAFADRPAAEAFARGKMGSRVLGWKDVPALVPEKTGMGMGMGASGKK